MRRSGTGAGLVVGVLAECARLSCVGMVAGAAGVASFASTAQAEIKAEQPYYVAAVQAETEIKCSDGGAFYAVARVKAGQMLQADGSGGGWVRVKYLPGMRAFVKPEEVQVDATGKSAKLLVPSKLMAASEKLSERSSWWPLLDQTLAPGSMLDVVETLKSANGAVYGYLVNAPSGARGYVRDTTVRKASPEEIAAYEKSIAPPPPSPTPTPTPAPAGAPPASPTRAPAGTASPAAGSTPAPGTAAPATTSPATTSPASTAPSAPGSAVPGFAPVTPAPTTPGSTTPGTTSPVPGTPGASEPAPAPAPAPAPPPAPKPIDDLTLLAEKFDTAMSTDAGGAEIDTVIGEFNRRIAATSDASVKSGLQRRLDALKLKKELNDRAAKLKAASNFDEKEIRVRDAVANAQRQAVYTIVGRILPSTVYDGKRGMPLMYRVEAADSASTRTIGYVVPREGVELLTKTGKVVGIVGESRFDEALRLNIVAARRVDVLNPSAGVFEAEKPATGKPAPAAPSTEGGDEGEAGAEDGAEKPAPDSPPGVTVEDPAMDGK